MAKIFSRKKIPYHWLLTFAAGVFLLSLVFPTRSFSQRQETTEAQLEPSGNWTTNFSLPKTWGKFFVSTKVTSRKDSGEEKITTNTSKTETLSSASQNQNTPIQPSSLGSLEAQILNLTNKARTSRGLKPYTSPSNLNSLAEKRSADMANKNYFSHTSPSGESAFTLLKKAGIDYKTAGENIGRNNYPVSQTAQKVFDGWMGSSGHKANILSTKFTSIGIGVVTNSSGMKYYTQIFVGN